MKRIIILLLLAIALFGGDWKFENITGSAGETFSFDTIEVFLTNTFEVGNNKALPSVFTITHFLTPTSDSVDFHIRLDYTNDKTNWYTYTDIDTVDASSPASGTVIDGHANATILPFRYFRLQLQSNTVDTFSVKLQKSINF